MSSVSSEQLLVGSHSLLRLAKAERGPCDVDYAPPKKLVIFGGVCGERSGFLQFRFNRSTVHRSLLMVLYLYL